MELNTLVSARSCFLPGTCLLCTGLTQGGAEAQREKPKVPLCQGVTLIPALAVGRAPEEIVPSLLQLKGWFEVGSKKKTEFLPHPCIHMGIGMRPSLRSQLGREGGTRGNIKPLDGAAPGVEEPCL